MYIRADSFNRPSRLGAFFSEAAARREVRLEDLTSHLRDLGYRMPVPRSIMGHLHILANSLRTLWDAVRTPELLRACQHRDHVLLKHYDAALELADPQGELYIDLTLQRAAIVADLHEGRCHLEHACLAPSRSFQSSTTPSSNLHASRSGPCRQSSSKPAQSRSPGLS